jgi:hypothetical protein
MTAKSNRCQRRLVKEELIVEINQMKIEVSFFVLQLHRGINWKPNFSKQIPLAANNVKKQ